MKEKNELAGLKRLLPLLSFASALALVLSACAPATGAAPVLTSTPRIIPTEFSSREAQVQRVEIQTTGNEPAQVNAVVRGLLTEACAKLGESQVEYAGNTFRITVYVLSRTDVGCAQAETPFETTIPLETGGLAAGTYTVIANGVSAVFTLPLVSSTASSAPTSTAIISVTSSPAPTAVTDTQGCTDAAAFVSDVSVPDNSLIAANAPFTKIWRVRNTGTCTWDNSYLVFYISGTTMSQSPGYWLVQPGQKVPPGQTVDVSVGMTAPPESGSYASYWGLKKENGSFMPIQGGANGNSFYVKIRVGGGTGTGNITGASIEIVLEQGSGAACTPNSTYFVSATISSDGPATANYEINSTAGQIAAGNFQDLSGGLSPVIYGTLVFDRADTKTVSLRFVGPYPYPDDITVNLRVNGGEWHSSKLSCQ
ncbi:MAG: NBR1-Ig-like domain-containing protein [Bacteroidota bacterium]